MTHTRRFRLLASLSGLVALFLTGCQTYTQQTAAQVNAFQSGNYGGAAAQANKDAEKNKDNKDTILYRLEQGAINRAAALADLPAPAVATTGTTGVTNPQTETNIAEQAEVLTPTQQYFNTSNEAFDLAEERVNKYEEEAKVKVGSNLGATLTNQANLPYRGRAYDKVMMNTYKALNYMAIGDLDAARVELNRALQRQRDAVDENAKRIQEAQAEAEAAKEGNVTDEQGRKGQSYDVEKAKADPKTGSALAAVEAEVDSAILSTYADYVNPYSVFLDGLYFLYQGADAADLERARKSLERVCGMTPDNAYIQADLVAASTAQTPSNVTYVIFETGTAPWRDQIRIDIPTFLVTSSLSYVGASFPKLQFENNYAQALSVADSAGHQLNTSVVCDMDSVIAKDFKNEWPTIVTKTLISTATKAILDAVIQKQAKDQFGFTGQLLAKVATAATQAAINIADTRTWRSLPKQFQYLRIETPADRTLTLSTGLSTSSVVVEPGDVNVVYVKNTSLTAPVLVSQFKLK